MNPQQAVKLSGIRAAIIDLDGTMVDTALDFHAAVNRMREELSLAPQDIELIRTFVGKGFVHLVRSSLGVDLSEAALERIFPKARDSFLRHYETVNGEWSRLYPEVMQGLEAMREKGLKLACVTNKQAVFALPLLEKMGVHTMFDVIYPGDALPQKKPDPMPMLAVFERFGLQPREVVAIGDSINDSEAARAAGCWVLAVSYGYNHGRPVQEVESDGIVHSLMEAANYLA
ncbi:MAG: phosphoglycolate phosphatase [Oxalobacter sp.]|nr:MAG: phosphoglycolate phosphatase [Oxalobacter sp.]